jgi:hypothetical protein
VKSSETRRIPPRLLLSILAAPALLGGCTFFAGELPLQVVLPEVPAHWHPSLGEPAWRVVVPGTGSEPPIGPCLPVDPGTATFSLEVPKILHVPVLAYPVAARGCCTLPPAAAVYPIDLGADHRTIVLSWERGPAGEILRRLAAQGVDLETLNVPRLCREIDDRFVPDPWVLDLDRAAAALASGSFRVTELRGLDRRDVRLPLGPGSWFLESPFCSPVEVTAWDSQPGLELPSVPVGFHRLFEREAGWVADLFVTERELLWVPASPGGGCTGKELHLDSRTAAATQWRQSCFSSSVGCSPGGRSWTRAPCRAPDAGEERPASSRSATTSASSSSP